MTVREILGAALFWVLLFAGGCIFLLFMMGVVSLMEYLSGWGIYFALLWGWLPCP